MWPRLGIVLAFLLNHSTEYTVAMLASLAEYALRSALFGRWTLWLPIRKFGLALTAVGLFVRIFAMNSAAGNFSHDVRYEFSKARHRLVTSGIYGVCRHPSYLGFGAFAIGCQIILGNTLCTAIYCIVLHKFFRERIAVEEAALMRQYPQEYQKYRRTTWSGLPYID